MEWYERVQGAHYGANWRDAWLLYRRGASYSRLSIPLFLTLSPSTTELWIEREKQKRNASCTRTHKKTGAIVPWIQKENRKHQPQTSLRRFPSSIFKEWTDKMKSTRVAVSLFYICIIFTGVCVFFENDKEIDITYYFIVTSAYLTFYILQIS